MLGYKLTHYQGLWNVFANIYKSSVKKKKNHNENLIGLINTCILSNVSLNYK